MTGAPPSTDKPAAAEQASGLGRHSSAYIVGSAVAVLGGMVLLPVYTHALSPEEYGLLETALRFVTLCIVVAFVGLRQGFLRFYFDDSTEAWHKTLTSTTVAGVFLIGMFAMVPLLAVTTFFTLPLQIPRLSLATSVLLGCWVSVEAIYTIGLSFMQVRFMSTRYLGAQCVRVALLVGVNYLMLIVLDLGLNGALLGNFVTSLVSGLVAAALLLRWSGVRVSLPTVRNLIKFGAPYLPAALFAYIGGNADRLSLLHFGFAASLGLLSLASKLGEIALSVLMSPLENIWMPYALSVRSDPDGPSKIGMLYMRYTAIMIGVGLLISLAAPAAIRILASDEFADAVELVPLVSIGCIFVSVATLSDLGIVIAKRTVLKPIITGVVAVIAVALQLLLTPRAGVVGAVTGTVLTTIVAYLIIHFTARRLYRIQIDSRVVLSMIVAAAVAYVVGKLIFTTFPSILGNAAAVAIGMTLYGSALHLTRLITFADMLDFIKQTLRLSSGTSTGGSR